MKAIQAVLIAAAALWAFTYAARFRGRGVARLLALGGVVVAVILVMAPELTVHAASLVGVGRGVDLVFYVGFAVGAFLVLHLSGRIERLEARLTEVSRQLALTQPVSVSRNEPALPGEPDGPSPLGMPQR